MRFFVGNTCFIRKIRDLKYCWSGLDRPGCWLGPFVCESQDIYLAWTGNKLSNLLITLLVYTCPVEFQNKSTFKYINCACTYKFITNLLHYTSTKYHLAS